MKRVTGTWTHRAQAHAENVAQVIGERVEALVDVNYNDPAFQKYSELRPKGAKRLSRGTAKLRKCKKCKKVFVSNLYRFKQSGEFNPNSGSKICKQCGKFADNPIPLDGEIQDLLEEMYKNRKVECEWEDI